MKVAKVFFDIFVKKLSPEKTKTICISVTPCVCLEKDHVRITRKKNFPTEMHGLRPIFLNDICRIM